MHAMGKGLKWVVLIGLLACGCTKPTVAPTTAGTEVPAPTAAPVPTKAAQCEDVRKKLSAVRGGDPARLERFCVENLTPTEISCVVEAANSAKVKACFEQDYRSAMVVLCGASDKMELSGDAAEDQYMIQKYIAKHLRNSDVIQTWSAIGGAGMARVAELLDEMAKTANLPDCAYANYLTEPLE